MADIADAKGGLHNDRQSIADIFADFYGDLYESKRTGQDTEAWSVGGTSGDIPPFSRSELVAEIQGLKTGKAKDTSGVMAEMIKDGGDVVVDVLLVLYNEILASVAATPDDWKQTAPMVLHKSGDRSLPQNYRPISIIPMLYKLFARLLARRLAPIPDPQQSNEQAGSRKHFST